MNGRRPATPQDLPLRCVSCGHDHAWRETIEIDWVMHLPTGIAKTSMYLCAWCIEQASIAQVERAGGRKPYTPPKLTQISRDEAERRVGPRPTPKEGKSD